MFSFFRKSKPPIPRDLENVIYDIAEKQNNEDFLTLCRLMQGRQVFIPILSKTLPGAVVPGVKYVTGKSDRLEMRSVTTPTGEIAAFCTTHEDAAMLKDGYVGMEWTEFLAVVLKLDESIKGALLQGKTSWIVFDRSRIKFILGGEWAAEAGHSKPTELATVTTSQPQQTESSQALDTVVVPPGHQVVVFHPALLAHVDLAASGALIVDYGPKGDWRGTNVRLDASLATKQGPAVVILQDEMIDAICRSNELDEFLAYWKKSKDKDVSAVWVLPLAASKQDSVIASIRSAGYSVHTSAADGACFVEVHKSDGSITVGMPGPQL